MASSYSPGLVGEIRDRLSVGRPRGIAVGDGGTARDIANVAFVGGNRENLSPGFEQSARPSRREVETLNALGFNLGEVRPHRLKVAGNMDRNVRGLMRIQIVDFDGAELLDDNGVGTG